MHTQKLRLLREWVKMTFLANDGISFDFLNLKFYIYFIGHFPHPWILNLPGHGKTKLIIKSSLMNINAFRRRGWGWMDWEFGISRCKLLYREWINNKVLLCSTGTYIQYPVINHNGKRYKKECTYVQLNHFAERQKLTQHCKSTILQ